MDAQQKRRWEAAMADDDDDDDLTLEEELERLNKGQLRALGRKHNIRADFTMDDGRWFPKSKKQLIGELVALDEEIDVNVDIVKDANPLGMSSRQRRAGPSPSPPPTRRSTRK